MQGGDHEQRSEQGHGPARDPRGRVAGLGDAVRRFRRLSAPKYPGRGALAGLTIHRRTWNPTVTHRQDDAATFMRNAVEAAIKAGASTAIPAAVLSAIDGATVRPIDQK